MEKQAAPGAVDAFPQMHELSESHSFQGVNLVLLPVHCSFIPRTSFPTHSSSTDTLYLFHVQGALREKVGSLSAVFSSRFTRCCCLCSACCSGDHHV